MSGEPNQVERILNVVPSPRQGDDWTMADAIDAEILAEPLAETVPALIGLTREDAKRIATKNGFRVYTNPPESETTTEWWVEGQEPQANSLASKGRTITIFLKSPRAVGDE